MTEIVRRTIAETIALHQRMMDADVKPVIEDFRKKGVAVGRPFPPMTQHLRVSVGTADEMRRFSKAFKEIFTGPAPAVGVRS